MYHKLRLSYRLTTTYDLLLEHCVKLPNIARYLFKLFCPILKKLLKIISL